MGFGSIYPLDTTIQALNNWSQTVNLKNVGMKIDNLTKKLFNQQHNRHCPA